MNKFVAASSLLMMANDYDKIGAFTYADRLERAAQRLLSDSGATDSINSARLAALMDGIDWDERSPDGYQAYQDGLKNNPPPAPEDYFGPKVENETVPFTGLRIKDKNGRFVLSPTESFKKHYKTMQGEFSPIQ